MSHLSKLFWALVMWSVAGIVITLLHETPAWSVKTFLWVVTDELTPTGVLAFTIIMLVLMILYVGVMVRAWALKHRFLLGQMGVGVPSQW